MSVKNSNRKNSQEATAVFYVREQPITVEMNIINGWTGTHSGGRKGKSS
jgi:hypothetical protein